MIGVAIVAGLGFRSQCPADELVALIRQAEQANSVSVTALATPAFKALHDGLTRAAAELGLPVRHVTPEGLADAQAACLTHSTAALVAVGVASVAEACALAAAGEGSRLLAPRIASASATCALARGDLL